MPKLVNFRRLHEDFPKEFKLPAKTKIEKLKSGDLVILSNGQENFKVQITKKETGAFEGRIENYLLRNETLDFGKIIKFRPENIKYVLT